MQDRANPFKIHFSKRHLYTTQMLMNNFPFNLIQSCKILFIILMFRPIKKTNNGMAETFGEQNMLDVPVGSMYGRGGLDNEGSFNLKSYESKPVDSGQMRNSYSQ